MKLYTNTVVVVQYMFSTDWYVHMILDLSNTLQQTLKIKYFGIFAVKGWIPKIHILHIFLTWLTLA